MLAAMSNLFLGQVEETLRTLNNVGNLVRQDVPMYSNAYAAS